MRNNRDWKVWSLVKWELKWELKRELREELTAEDAENAELTTMWVEDRLVET